MRTHEFTRPLQGVPYYSSAGIIKALDSNGAQFPVAEIIFERFDDQNYQYTVKPYRKLITNLPDSVFSGIPGFDLDTGGDVYYRVNMTPAFIEMRTPSPNREDVQELLEEVGLDYYDRFEWLLRCNKRCGDDNLIVVRKRESRSFNVSEKAIELNEAQPGDDIYINDVYDISTSGMPLAYQVFRLLSTGAHIHSKTIHSFLSSDSISASMDLLKTLVSFSENKREIRQRVGIDRAKSSGAYHGRNRIHSNVEVLERTIHDFLKKKISEQQAISILGISRSTLYRRIKELELMQSTRGELHNDDTL